MMKTKNYGFTMVELMVAITISLVGVLAATEVYVSTRQTNRLQAMQSRLTEDGRFAVSMLQRFVSQARFRSSPATGLPTGLLGYEQPISLASNALTLRFSPDGANQIACDGSVLAADITTSFPTFQIQSPAGSFSLQCARMTTPAVFPAPVSWIAPATAGAGNGTEVADFAVLLGIDTTGPAGVTPDYGCGVAVGGFSPRDCITDIYVAALPPLVTPNQVTAVRVCLVLRSEATDSSVVKPAPVQNCAGADIADSQNDRQLYRTFWTTVSLKNSAE